MILCGSDSRYRVLFLLAEYLGALFPQLSLSVAAPHGSLTPPGPTIPLSDAEILFKGPGPPQTDKISGKVACAVMSFGGFMGIVQDYYPLPWTLLTYSPQLEGYEFNLERKSSRMLRNRASMRLGTGAHLGASDPSTITGA
jgi:hypothetical protein